MLQVTTVDNLEAYGIDLDEFSAAIQTGVSCHSSVVPSSDKPKGKKQVTVQGNQIKFIEKLLKGMFVLTAMCIVCDLFRVWLSLWIPELWFIFTQFLGLIL